jgi:hypothetical protein
MARLLAVLAPVLEQNISEETIVSLKRETNEQVMRIAFVLHDKLPGATMEDCAFVAATINTLVAGLWPAAHPAPIVDKVLATPEFAHLRLDPAHVLERALVALLDSIVPGGGLAAAAV